MALHSTGRIDDLIVQFERLQSDAHDIFNARVEELRRDSPNAGFGALKTKLPFYKLWRQAIAGESDFQAIFLP